jgi:hypothetical protein
MAEQLLLLFTGLDAHHDGIGVLFNDAVATEAALCLLAITPSHSSSQGGSGSLR